MRYYLFSSYGGSSKSNTNIRRYPEDSVWEGGLWHYTLYSEKELIHRGYRVPDTYVLIRGVII